MSASLVGSEMCIRDRRIRAWALASAGCRIRAPRARRARRGLAAHPGPVSYTHLTLPTICSV
eukprot:3104130-Alexandrium_andersonii.AAC.1